jgi:hypothetical protein
MSSKRHSRRKRKPYYANASEAGRHDVTGEVSVGDRVILRGYPDRAGVVQGVTRANRGRGRACADVLWPDGSSQIIPLGALRKAT